MHAARPGRGSRKTVLIAAAAVLLTVLIGAAQTPVGGWVQSFVAGSGVRWQDAYRALDAAETNLPREPRERERLLPPLPAFGGKGREDPVLGPMACPPAQDLFDDKPRRFPSAPARVTLLEACPARVRVGAITRVEFFPYAIVPIPRGLRTVRWVQLDGCPTLTTP